MKEEKLYTVKSPKGVEYTVGEAKAKFLVKNFDCTWIGDEPKEAVAKKVNEEDKEPQKRKRRTKAEIEADKAKEDE